MTLSQIALMVLAIAIVVSIVFFVHRQSKHNSETTRVILFCKRMGWASAQGPVTPEEQLQSLFMGAEEALHHVNDISLQRLEFHVNRELATQFGITESSLPALLCQHLERTKDGAYVPVYTRVEIVKSDNGKIACLDRQVLIYFIASFAAARRRNTSAPSPYLSLAEAQAKLASLPPD